MPDPQYPVVHISDRGTVFRATIVDDDGVAVNLTGYTVSFRFMPPSGVAVDKDATAVDLTTGVVQYAGELGFLSQTGPWRWQATATETAGSSRVFHSSIERFTVEANL